MAKRYEQDIRERAFKLGARVFWLYPRLAACGVGHAVLALQMMKAVTSAGSQLEEGAAPSSRRDMAHKYGIALRESREGRFWARLLQTDPQWTEELQDVVAELTEFVAMLTTAVKRLRQPPKVPTTEPTA